eukprot:TRINITY_DN979_c0_g1_i12.p1 TRINITY_DN979_c0_g1~~TRINITY_DN979_c0_g1_i12.p1  ORF type:complete len:393 (+),score=118.91 TRINITY_DN979_c0_g1_i12:340-1518(+)
MPKLSQEIFPTEKKQMGVQISPRTYENFQGNSAEISADNYKYPLIGVLLSLAVVIAVGLVAFFVVRRRRRFQVERQVDNIQMEKFRVRDLQVEQKIGEGSFGAVFRGKWLGTPVACKQIKADDWDAFRSEVDTLTKLNHPNVVQYLGTYDNGDDKYIIMELMTGGSLSRLVSHEDLSFDVLIDIAIQCAKGMVYLVDQKILHRDLALRNVLVNLEKRFFVAKLADFGMAKMVDARSRSLTSTQERIPLRWSAVEVLEHGIFTEKSDVWSFGCMLWELFSKGKMPYENMTVEESVSGVLKGERLFPPKHLPETLRDLMSSCWIHDPQHRPTFHDILRILKEIRPDGEVVGISATNEDDAVYNISIKVSEGDESSYNTKRQVKPSNRSLQDIYV